MTQHQHARADLIRIGLLGSCGRIHREVETLDAAGSGTEPQIAEERIETRATNVSELFAELSAGHAFSFQLDQLRAAINEDFCEPTAELADNDTLALMPPMAGG